MGAPERRPRLLHVFPNFVATGPEMRTVHLIEAFGERFEHAVVSLDGRTEAADRLPPGAPVRLLPSPPRAGSLATARRLRELLRSERPDLLLTYNWAAIDMLLAARSIGWRGFRPVVHHEEGFNEDEAETFKRRRVLARRALLPGVERLVVPSERLRRIALETWRVPAERVRLIPNGVDLVRFRPRERGPAPGELRKTVSAAGVVGPELPASVGSPLSEGGIAALRASLGIPAGVPLAGSLGSLRPVKNFARLLEAAANVDPALDLHVLLVGDGPERAALAERAARPDVAGRVHFAGYQADPAPWLAALDLFVLSSDSEQMPVALLEAMASALPVAATDVGDVRAILPDEQAPFLVPLTDTDPIAALARTLAELARDPALRRRLGEANRRRAEERYGFAAMRDAYAEVYAEALAARP
jgi:L-malate glycosyltransferase